MMQQKKAHGQLSDVLKKRALSIYETTATTWQERTGECGVSDVNMDKWLWSQKQAEGFGQSQD